MLVWVTHYIMGCGMSVLGLLHYSILWIVKTCKIIHVIHYLIKVGFLSLSTKRSHHFDSRYYNQRQVAKSRESLPLFGPFWWPCSKCFTCLQTWNFASYQFMILQFLDNNYTEYQENQAKTDKYYDSMEPVSIENEYKIRIMMIINLKNMAIKSLH